MREGYSITLGLSLAVGLMGCAGKDESQAGTPNDASQLSERCTDGDLKSGEVKQLAFTRDGKYLVGTNEFKYFIGHRRECHGRLRAWDTANWKLVGDTGELSQVGLYFVASNTDTWFAQGKRFHRFGTGSSNPLGEPVFCKFNPVTMERKQIDVINQVADNQNFLPWAMACASDRSLCAYKLDGSGEPTPPFVVDLRTWKRTVDLQEFSACPKALDADNAVPVFEFSPNGKNIASFKACMPYQMQLHNADTGKLVKSSKLRSPVGAIQFSPDGKLLAAVCLDGTLLIFQPDLSKQIFSKQFENFSFEKYGGFPRPIAFVGDGNLAVIASDTRIELLDTKEWKSVRTFDCGKTRVNCVASSPDGKLLAAGFGVTAQSPGFLRVYDKETGKRVVDLR